MRRKEAKTVVMYYRAIPGMIGLLRQEQTELESEYDTLHSAPLDGMPHGSAPGKPTEALAIHTAESGTYERLEEIKVRLLILEGDAAMIRGGLDALNGKYKKLLTLRLLHGYSWGKLSARMGAPDSTIRYWFSMALDQLARVLEEVPMPEELAARASRARSL